MKVLLRPKPPVLNTAPQQSKTEPREQMAVVPHAPLRTEPVQIQDSPEQFEVRFLTEEEKQKFATTTLCPPIYQHCIADFDVCWQGGKEFLFSKKFEVSCA